MKLINKVKQYVEEAGDGVDDHKLRQFQVALEEKTAKLKELDSEILGYLYEIDTEDDICENEAKQAQEIQENITYQLICVKDALKEIQDGNSPVHLRSGPLSNSRESIASNLKESVSLQSKESVVSVPSNGDC